MGESILALNHVSSATGVRFALYVREVPNQTLSITCFGQTLVLRFLLALRDRTLPGVRHAVEHPIGTQLALFHPRAKYPEATFSYEEEVDPPAGLALDLKKPVF